VFPGSAERKFATGETIDLVLGFTNNGQREINITSIVATLRYPVDWKVHVQNFTRKVFGVTVNPTEQASFHYSFAPDALLEPREFGVTANVYYEDTEGANFTSVFCNHTILLVEPVDNFDAQTLFTYVGITAIAGLVGFVLFNLLKSSKKQRRGPKVEYGTQKRDVVDNDWLEGTMAVNNGKSQKSPKTRKAKTT